MIAFINFLITLVWAFIKLLGSLIIAFVLAAICHGMAVAIGAMYYKARQDKYSVWEEIAEMERREYGDNDGDSL